MSRVARRYAKALFALAQEEGQIEPVGARLDSAARIFEDPDVARIASNPLVSAERRRALADTVSQQLELSSLLSRFLRMLADRARLDQLASISDHYRRLEDDALNRTRLRVRSAKPLEDRQREQISQVFAKALGRTILPHLEVDPALLGGVVVEAEGKVYDGSLRTQLERLARQITHSNPQS